jgi:hypothetical protein
MAKFTAPKQNCISKKIGINNADLYKMQHNLDEMARKDKKNLMKA